MKKFISIFIYSFFGCILVVIMNNQFFNSKLNYFLVGFIGVLIGTFLNLFIKKFILKS